MHPPLDRKSHTSRTVAIQAYYYMPELKTIPSHNINLN